VTSERRSLHDRRRVDEHVERSEAVDNRPDERHRDGRIAEVARQRLRLGTSLLDQRGSFARALIAPVEVHSHAHALCAEGDSDCAADAAAGAGD